MEPRESRATASPESRATASHAASRAASPAPHAASPRERPVMHRFYSTPDLLSPGRQQFRLKNAKKRNVKETLGINECETPVGRLINQYQIKQTLGSGRYGQVMLAVDTTTGTELAIKQLSKQDILKSNRKKLMQLRRRNQSVNASELIGKEIAIMKKIDHPNLVELVEVLEDKGSDSLYMVMEWCRHGPINVSGELDERQCRLYFRDLILAVEYLHSLGVTHRDIKAENMLLGSGDVLKLADFGLSELVESGEKDSVQSCVGSPAYYAPELAHLAHGGFGDPGLSVVSGRKTDIWAMGVTLYYMYHGHLPFENETLGELYGEICEREPTFGPEISAPFRDLLEKLFIKDNKSRISMDDLRNHPWVTRNNTDPLLGYTENTTSSVSSITEADLCNAIDKAKHLFNERVTPSRVSRLLYKSHGWRGTSPAEDEDEDEREGEREREREARTREANLNVEKLVRALEEMVRIEGAGAGESESGESGETNSPALTPANSLTSSAATSSASSAISTPASSLSSAARASAAKASSTSSSAAISTPVAPAISTPATPATPAILI